MLNNHPRTIDLDIIKEQHARIKNSWPNVTPEALKDHSGFCELYTSIRAFNLPNFLGARIDLDSALNLEMWEELLDDYHDKEVCVFLRYGCSVGYNNEAPPTSVHTNHQSARRDVQHVKKFIHTELSHGALVGPFMQPPFTPWTRVSPILTRPKKDSIEKRIIVDLSFPEGEAVNTGIDIRSVYGRDLSYTLPNIKDLIAILQSVGPGAWMWKADLSRAYRQLRVDPLDCPLLVMKVGDEYFIDLCPSFSCRSSSAACQRVSNALAYIMGLAGCQILAYLDDYAAVAATFTTAKKDYDNFMKTTEKLGLKLAVNKCKPPSTKIEWLGFDIDSVIMCVSIPKKKLEEVLEVCKHWKTGSRISKQSLQSLVGRLIHLTNGIAHGRKFTAQLLASLRAMNNKDWSTITHEASLDIKWFIQYASISNGISFFSLSRPSYDIECDTCLSGGGGHSSSHYYMWRYNSTHAKKYGAIHCLEAINLLVAYKTLTPQTVKPGSHVNIFTDNISSAVSLMSGKTKDEILGACARQMWLEAAWRDHSTEALFNLSFLVN